MKVVVEDGTVDVEEGDLVWGSDSAIELPAETKSWVLTINRADGTSKTVIKPDSYDRYFVEYDKDSRFLIIKPKGLNQVL